MLVMFAEDIGGWLVAGALLFGSLASSVFALGALYPAFRGMKALTFCLIAPAVLVAFIAIYYFANAYLNRIDHHREEIMLNYVQPWLVMGFPPLITSAEAQCCWSGNGERSRLPHPDMKIPAFKSSKHFLGDTGLPCLFAKVKSSLLPGVAARHVTRYREDPVCEIYLRGKDSAKVSPWQRKFLKQFFEKEKLAAAIEEAMKDYGKSDEAYFGASRKDRKLMQEEGIAPFMTISTIVIDEIKKEVILCARNEWDGNLIEHGISIYLRKGRWRFDHADYYIRYASAFDESANWTPKQVAASQTAEIASVAAELQSITSGFQAQAKKWEAVFPLDSGAPVDTNPAFLYGDWKFDARKTEAVLKQLGQKKDEIESRVEMQENLGCPVYHFAPGAMHLIVDGDASEDTLCGCRRRGKRVSILYRIKGGENVLTAEHWCDGEFLVEQSGLAYRRVKGSNLTQAPAK